MDHFTQEDNAVSKRRWLYLFCQHCFSFKMAELQNDFRILLFSFSSD